MKRYLLILTIAFVSCNSDAQVPPSKVDFDAFEKLTSEVKDYRKDRLIAWSTFKNYSKEGHTIILDTRSKEMFDRKHLKGAINLNFSDFTQAHLSRIIPSQNTRVLIYCNNNFANDEINFTSKMYVPKKTVSFKIEKTITLALNIPTFINLYGYGYKNVYELSELISVFDERVAFEGTDVPMNLTLKN